MSSCWLAPTPAGPAVKPVAAALVYGLLGALAVFQALLMLGVPLGRFAWGGQHPVLPMALRVGNALSIAIHAVLAAIVLDRANMVTTKVPDAVGRTAAWIVVGYFFIGIGMNLASRSKSERAVMTPTVAVLCALRAVVAAS